MKGAGTLVLRGGRVFDGTGSDPHRADVTVEDGRIAAVHHGGAAPQHDGVLVDIDGLVMMPGLIDLHTHLGVIDLTGESGHTAAGLAVEIFRNLNLCLDAGFTTVRDLGGLDGAVAQLVAAGRLRGPRILPSGPLLCQTAGHGDLADPFTGHDPVPSHPGLTQFSQPCDGPDEVRRTARSAFQRGATQLKMCLSGGVVSHTDRLEDVQFTVGEVAAAVAEARSRQTYVTAHAHNTEAIRLGLEAGVTCFEHGVLLDEPTADAMAESGAVLVPTLSNGELMVEHWRAWRVPEEVLPRARLVRDRMYEAVRIAQHAGVAIGSGSDLLGPSQDRRGLELGLKSRVLGVVAALMSATRDNARLINRGDELGTIEAGKVADVIAVDEDVYDDLRLLEDASRVRLVVQEGTIVKDTR